MSITKQRRQEIIFQLLRGRDAESGLTAQEIHDELEKDGIEINLRSVRRDLEDLSTTHGLSSDGHPERFFPTKDYSMKYELQLNESTLQVLLIALNNLKHTSHKYFENYATEAETALLRSLDPSVANCLKEAKKAYHFDYSASGKPSSENIKDFEKIMQAMRENKTITCYNDSPYQEKEYNNLKRNFAPRMFILTSSIPYIIVQDLDDSQLKKPRVSRIRDVRLTNRTFDPIDLKEELDLKSAVGGWGGISQKPINIEIICDNVMGTYFKEKSIHPSQKINKLSENKYQVNFKCAKSYEVTRLIASFGGHVESISPDDLFEEVKGIWESGLNDVG